MSSELPATFVPCTSACPVNLQEALLPECCRMSCDNMHLRGWASRASQHTLRVSYFAWGAHVVVDDDDVDDVDVDDDGSDDKHRSVPPPPRPHPLTRPHTHPPSAQSPPPPSSATSSLSLSPLVTGKCNRVSE